MAMKQTTFSDDDYTPEESAQVFERAAQLQSEDTFAAESGLDGATLEKSAGRAGIDEKYVRQAVEELRSKERDAAEQKRLVEQARTQRAALLKKIALPAAVIIGLYLIMVYSLLNNKLAAVENQQAQLENVLQRRHDLVPNLIAAYKEAAPQAREEVKTLSRLEEQSKNAPDLAARSQLETQLSGAMKDALNTVRREPGETRLSINLSTQMEGAENRISVERKRYNEAVVEYNRSARGFPIVLVRPLLGFPAQKPPFQMASGAHEAPKF